MFVDQFCLLLAQTPGATSIPTSTVVLAFSSVILGLIVTWFFSVRIPEFRDELNERQSELDETNDRLVSLRTDNGQTITRLEQEVAEAKSQVEASRAEASRQAEKKQQPGRSDDAPRLKRELTDAKLAVHVLRRVQGRLEQSAHERASSHRREVDRLTAGLHAALLELHVKQRLQDRLEEHARSAVETATSPTSAESVDTAVVAESTTATPVNAEVGVLRSQLVNARLDLHVKTRLASRLGREIQNNSSAILEGNEVIGDLQSRLNAMRSELKTHSESLIQRKLEQVEREKNNLQRMHERLQADGSPVECIELLAGADVREPGVLKPVIRMLRTVGQIDRATKTT